MKINFLVPTLGLTGGMKVIFQHANNLEKFGHEIAIICPLVLNKDAALKEKIIGVVKAIKYLLLKIFGRTRVKWFKLDKKIKIFRPFDLSFKNVPKADITIATANETADWLIDYPFDRGEKFYFIQDYENWTRSLEKVDATYKMPLKKIVISSQLKELIENKFQEKVYGLVPNGINLNCFYNNHKTFNKDKRILMMYHVLEKKGFKEGLKAFKIVKEKYPEINLTVFGAYKYKNNSDFNYYYQPKIDGLRKLYCDCDIFVWPSREEGYGLPPMEAMACGCAVISTDTGAIREYAIDGQTVIIVPSNNSEILAQKIIELIEDEDKLKNLSANAQEKIKEFSLDKSSSILENILKQNINYDKNS